MTGFFSFWRKGSVRSLFYQWGLVFALSFGIFFVINTAKENLERLGIKTGFGFLSDEAGFAISQSIFDYSTASSNWDAIVVTFANTIILSVIAGLFATFFGFFVAMARLSANFLLRKLGEVYVEIFRNIPLLLQLFFWYFAALKMLPDKRQSVNFFDVAYLNIEGLMSPSPVFEAGSDAIFWSILIAFLLAITIWFWATRRQTNTGEPFPALTVGIGLIFALPLIVMWLLDFPVTWDIPKFGRFNFEGGMALQPEFVAMLFGLTLYNSAFIGEILRAGILSVDKGQREAAGSIGLSQIQTYRKIIVPQAMRLIIPPLTNQYLNLAKSTALAGAIGYADLFWAVNGAMTTQTSQTIELQAIILVSYLGISFFIATVMAIYNYCTKIPGK